MAMAEVAEAVEVEGDSSILQPTGSVGQTKSESVE